MGKDYWQGLIHWLSTTMIAEGKIGATDLDLLLVTDDVNEAVQHIVDADAALAADSMPVRTDPPAPAQ
jgi:predicted Rossmann-fold nucleotide-binding protein